jgi:hypothetical protein
MLLAFASTIILNKLAEEVSPAGTTIPVSPAQILTNPSNVSFVFRTSLIRIRGTNK